MSEASPRPWRISNDDKTVIVDDVYSGIALTLTRLYGEKQAVINAKYITHCINNFDDLLETLENLCGAISTGMMEREDRGLRTRWGEAIRTITKAKGES